MADAVTSTTIIDGTHRAVIQLTNFSDGSGEAAVEKITCANLTARADGTACNGVFIDKIHHSVVGFTQVQLFWYATTNTIAIALAESSNGHMNFSDFGGIQNTSGSGSNGDIMLTTIGAANLDSYVIILDLLKHYG